MTAPMNDIDHDGQAPLCAAIERGAGAPRASGLSEGGMKRATDPLRSFHLQDATGAPGG